MPEGSETPSRIDHQNIAHVLDSIKDPFEDQPFQKALTEHLTALAVKHDLTGQTILYLLDALDDISSWHSNRIYKAASSAQRKADILLVLFSPGGSIEPAYLISKTCKRLARERFSVAIPRRAKSAATLLALGADQIHMGLMSELGPIDPQIGGFPALGIRNALEIFAQLSCKYPDASKMLGDYIRDKLDLSVLGYFERINESAMQYAERLLAGKQLPDPWTPNSLANHFVNHYKDHGFVIDYDEARSLLGGEVLKQETKEYAFCNDVYESFDLVRFVLRSSASKDLDLVGRGQSAVRLFAQRKAS